MIPALVGATGVGKTALSLEVADRIGAAIISMDSRQVYRGMDIGTAKVDPTARARIPHHGIDLIDPTERYSAVRFARDARGWVTGIVLVKCSITEVWSRPCGPPRRFAKRWKYTAPMKSRRCTFAMVSKRSMWTRRA